jgi:aminobenzoyl-glutamate utilization protein B
MRRAAVSLVALVGWFALPVAAQRPDIASARHAVTAEVDRLSPDIGRISSTLWTYSEIALKETRSAALLADLLERDGFRVTRGVAGMPTAFVAEWGSGKPVIGILAEYDALPGIGNEAVPRKQPREDGTRDGHGCGHNVFGAGSVGAALALKSAMARQHIAGTVRLFGCPAEETMVGKVFMARDGVFDGLDAALEWHPGEENQVGNAASQAMNSFTVEFFGQPAHAAGDPWNGRSALHAAELFVHGVNLMREHVKPTARLHYVVQSGGEAPNVVPAYTKIWMYARDADLPSVEAHLEWIRKIAEGAALATRTTSKVTIITGGHEYLFNRALQEAMQKNLEQVGAPAFDEADQRFARALQHESDLAEDGLDTAIAPLAPDVKPVEGGSTDVAEVSYLAPTAGLNVATVGKNLPWHSWQATASHGTPAATKAATIAAKVIALTAVDLLTQPALVERAHAEWVKRTEGKPYKSPVPADAKPPTGK